MTWPQPDRHHHDAFRRAEEWKRVRDARGRTGTHHVTHELVLNDGRILRTRISHPVDRTSYGPALWGHILRDQLDVTEDVFWNCALHGVLPDRGMPAELADAVPADVVYLLINRVGLTEAEVAALTKEQAVGRLQRYWTDGT